MVTDCLAPVISDIGVATIVTANGLNCMSAGLEWKKIKTETYYTTATTYYGLMTHDTALKTDWRSVKRRLWLHSEAMVETPEGWTQVTKLLQNEVIAPRLIKGYWSRCIVCQKKYLPRKPIYTTCSRMCLQKCFASNSLAFRPLNKTTVPVALIEDWVPLVSVYRQTLLAGIEGVNVTEIEGGESLYVAGILLSSLSLQKPGIIKK